MKTDSNSVLQDLDKDFAPAWKPEPGGKIAGIVTEISERDGGYGSYPIITLRADDGELAIHAFHEVLQNELARIAPKVGDLLGVAYLGKHEERGYHRYRVRRGGSESVTWAKYGDDAAIGAELHRPLEEDAATQEALEAERDERDNALSTE